MGLQNNRLKHHFMTSSSRWDKYHGPYRARLNIRRHGRYIGAWSSQYNNRYQWLQVDFAGPAKIIRICTQGRQDLNQWVTQYYVTRSLDAINYRPYKERNNIKVFFVGKANWSGKLLSFRLFVCFRILRDKALLSFGQVITVTRAESSC